jgi:hypothetical protein
MQNRFKRNKEISGDQKLNGEDEMIAKYGCT